jgi:Protein of unknown function (DUF2971)
MKLDTAAQHLPMVRSSYDYFVLPDVRAKSDDVRKSGRRFVHYSSAETALSILKSGVVRMRNATTMNDYTEVTHGLDCVADLMSNHRHPLRRVVDDIFPNAWRILDERLKAWFGAIQHFTFFACLSEHLESEDVNGRLSMWRAYGQGSGVAIVIDPAPIFSETNLLHVYAQPVLYKLPKELSVEFEVVASQIKAAEANLRPLGQEITILQLFQMLRFAAMCTKHPGFSEEREWRLIYAPAHDSSPLIESEIVSVGGVPQLVHKLPLRDFPDEGFVGAAIPSLVNRIIVGPTQYPFAIQDAFVRQLSLLGVANPEQRVFVSNIPLRV